MVPCVKTRERMFRRLFLRALGLFVGLFAVNIVVLAWLFTYDYEQRRIRSSLVEAQESVRALGLALQPEVAPTGAIDVYRVIERRVALGRLIDQYTAQVKFIKFVELVDQKGQVLLRRRLGERGGEWQMLFRGAFGGQAPPSPDSPPPFPMLSEGQAFRAVSQPLVRETPSGAVGELGAVRLGVAAALQNDWIARDRWSLIARTLLGGGVSLCLLAVAFLYVLRLVHKTRRLEADAQRAEQLAYLGTLASGLAHEIRNPLNAMNINLQMLEEELAAEKVSEEPVELLRSSRQEVLRLERLVKDFLAFARPQPTKREDLAPGALVADVVRFVRPLFAEAGVGLELVQGQGTPPVRVDAGQIRQALLNILQNALEVSPKGSRVLVNVVSGPRGEAQVEVRDQGPGIPADAREKIFEAFWSRKPAGSGLGLPIAQRAVENHGGRIEVESEPGAGSTFRIVLPSALAAALEPAAAGTGAEPSGAGA